MKDYSELVKALRETSMDFGELDSVSVMLLDAAAAIEALQDEVKDLKRVNMELFEDLPKYGDKILHWVSVEDELPKLPDEDYCHVWCAGWFEGQKRSVPMEYGRILKRGKREERWLLYDRISLPPTKWAYLPEPPQEVQE